MVLFTRRQNENVSPIVILESRSSFWTKIALFLTVSHFLLLPCTSFSSTLITFDVDGTLVRGCLTDDAETTAHSDAFGIACGKVFGGVDGKPTLHVSKALPPHKFHGSTDGLILLRLARAELNVDPTTAKERLPDLMDIMYKHIASLDDPQVALGMDPIEGVLDTLETLSQMKDRVTCGLVTGNVEGIARRKMRAVGIWDTGALSPPAPEQQLEGKWEGAEDIGFLGGFGSDFCSGDIDDADRNYLDRGEQIAIAARRCRELYKAQGVDDPKQQLRRVVHVGDAPADVLAAKDFAERQKAEEDENDRVCVGMVAVGTGRFSVEELRECAGTPVPGLWEPVILEDGMADTAAFMAACGL